MEMDYPINCTCKDAKICCEHMSVEQGCCVVLMKYMIALVLHRIPDLALFLSFLSRFTQPSLPAHRLTLQAVTDAAACYSPSACVTDIKTKRVLLQANGPAVALILAQAISIAKSANSEMQVALAQATAQTAGGSAAAAFAAARVILFTPPPFPSPPPHPSPSPLPPSPIIGEKCC